MNKLKNWIADNSYSLLKLLFKSWGEYVLLIVAVVLFLVSPYIFRWYDPTAGSFDIGVLQVNITSIISLCLFSCVSWAMLKILWPDIRCFFEDEFGKNFKSLTPWQKIATSLFVYFFIVLALVMLNQAIPAVQAPAIK